MRLKIIPLFGGLLAPLSLTSALTMTTSFNDGWHFTRDNVDVERAAAADYDSNQWLEVRLPHDWAISGPFDQQAHGSTGKLPWKGEGWYRKTFTLPEASPDHSRVYLDFDGVMAFPKVYINGQLAGEWDYGYTPFRIDATPHVRRGQDNTILVHVDTRKWGSRWYPGAGIYRKVQLTVAAPVHIAPWGTFVRTSTVDASTQDSGTAEVETTIENHSPEEREVAVCLTLIAPDGAVVDVQTRSHRIPARAQATISQTVNAGRPLLWDIEHPHLYTLRTTLAAGGETLESRDTRFGFRTFAFTAEDGFHLNGRRVQLKGVNLHHDLGPLGAAFNRRAAQRQLEIMQSIGVNAVRTAHNASAREVIELCDEMGLLVFNETFDKWEQTAGRPDLQPPLPEFGHRHLRNHVLRDRNSPSVVLWSIGNELVGGDAVDGINPDRVAMMAGFVRAYDSTRPVGIGNHIPGLVDGRNFASLDLTGWNYARRYARYRQVWPARPIIYSESASTLSTRGYYEPDLPQRYTDYPGTLQVSSYDLNAAPWSDIPDKEFRLMEDDAFVAGEFVWTGFDYLGEPTPFDAEARSSYFGIVDLCGFPKDRFYLYRSHWMPAEPTVHILPHWNWPERTGRTVPVFVYTNGDSAELFLNGRSLGVRRKGEVPGRPLDLAATNGTRTTASSGKDGAGAPLGGKKDAGWRPDEDDRNPWWQIDLGEVHAVRFITLDTPQRENFYAYTLSASNDGAAWRTLAEKETSPRPLYGGPSRVQHAVDTDARYLRIQFTDSTDAAPYGLDSFAVYQAPAENEYYAITYDYRLRWNEVPYEPGELHAVAYLDGQRVGEARVVTAGTPARLQLLADRTHVRADGEDLIFITVDACDEDGNLHPLADNKVRFSVFGPAEIAGVGNGNPLSFDPFQADHRKLFHGKALLIVRPLEGAGGAIEVRAEADGLASASITLHAAPQH